MSIPDVHGYHGPATDPWAGHTFDAEAASAQAAQVLGPAPPPVEPPSLNGHLPDTQIAAFLTDDFWTARPYLEHIRQAAHSRGRSAEALLGVVLARIAADTGHVVKLLAIVGSRSGLSLIVALTGPPGSGKSSCKAIATELVPAQLLDPECDDVPPGSGEGLIELLMGTEDDENTGKPVRRQVRTNAFVFVDEGEVLAQQARRSSSNTILPVLRSVFTDGTLGQANASDTTKRRVPGGQYVYGVALGIQPDKAGPLFDDAGGGTPQRFLWMPTDTPVPPPGERPSWPGELPRARLNFTGQPSGWKYLAVADNVADQIRHRDHQRQQHGCDPLDEHADLIRLKVAGVLAILDGRTDINNIDWHLAGQIMLVSHGTRARVLSALAKQRHAHNRARGEDDAERASTAETKRTDEAMQRVARWIIRRLTKLDPDALDSDGWANRKTMRGSLASYDRPHFDPAAHRLAEAGQIEIETDDEGEVTRCRPT